MGRHPEIAGGPYRCFPGFNPDARRGDGKLVRQRFHIFEGGLADHTIEGALVHALFDAFADRRDTGVIHPG